MVSMNKKPWYICFSLVAFALLWGDTAMRIKVFRGNSKNNMDLWNRACMNILQLGFLCGILPPIFIAVIANFVLGGIEPNSLISEVVLSIILFATYLSGVYAAYKHHKWRVENISHLLD